MTFLSSTISNLQDITTFPVYMTACDFEKSFTFDNKV